MNSRGARAHGDGRWVGDAPRPSGARPNYLLRRSITGLLVAVVLVVAVASGVTLLGQRDVSSGEVASNGVEQPAVEALVPAVESVSEPVELPIHHGYHDEVLYVALYGSIGTGSLGVLGEGDVAAAVQRAATVAADFEGFGPTVVPTFEIIASTASFDAGDGDYSNETPVSSLQQWVDAADDAGYHVVLDLQSGREEFPSQIRDFEPLLLEEHVSVALDPEWRVGPIGVPKGGEIGTVAADEVNRTVDWLDALIVEHDLPPKMLIVHQFTDAMIMNRPILRGTANVQVVLHMDGFGPLRLKRDTYDRVTADLPDGLVTGWKNFYDEDSPTPTAQETMDNDPQPMFVSFQ